MRFAITQSLTMVNHCVTSTLTFVTNTVVYYGTSVASTVIDRGQSLLQQAHSIVIDVELSVGHPLPRGESESLFMNQYFAGAARK